MKRAYSINHQYLMRNGAAYPITGTYISGESNDGNKKVLFPVTHKLIMQPADYKEWLDNYDGVILECYNQTPWLNESYGRSTSMWFKMTCAYINFDFYEYGSDGGATRMEQDEFGLCFRRVNADGDILDDLYENTYGGAKGAVVSAARAYSIGDCMTQPTTQVGSRCDFVSFDIRDTASGSESMDEYGWLGAVFRGNYIDTIMRKKDMVIWFYELEYDTGAWKNNYVQGTPNDATFSPGATGMRIISNKWKYSPWSRYPELIK